jgi:hypothetical protein
MFISLTSKSFGGLRGILCLFVVASLVSCHKSGGSSSQESGTIYVAGYAGDLSAGTAGAFWENGQYMIVPQSTPITAMCVADSDLYLLAGNTYWKNDFPHVLPYANISSSSAIAVLGSDVYVVAQIDTPHAIYFKNDSLVDLTPGIETQLDYAAAANGIAISENDLYICGNLHDSAVYWKNGTMHYLPGGYEAIAIAVSGSNVFAAGYNDMMQPVYWRNGVVQPLQPQTAAVNCIAASGDDVYVGGETGGVDKAIYWKNGSGVLLAGGAVDYGILVQGSTIYAAGVADPGFAVYWVNGVMHSLGTGSASSIAVGP